MFRLALMVEDKNLAKVLKGLGGLVYDLQVLPVQNAEIKKGRIQSTGMTASAAVEAVVKAAAANGKLVISTAEVFQGVKQHGTGDKSTMYGIKVAKDKGFLRQRTRGQYDIILANLQE